MDPSDEPSPFRGEYDADPPKPEAKPDLQPKRSYTHEPMRLMPQSPDAEKGVLSSFLISPNDVGGLCAEKRISKEHFFIPSHALIYEHLMGMWDRCEQIDIITLTQGLRDRGQLAQCGGAAFVTDLFTFLPTAANVGHYLDILHEKQQARQVIKVCTQYASLAYEANEQILTTVDCLEEEVLGIRKVGPEGTEHTPKALVVEAIHHIERIYDSRGTITGLSTGYAGIDRATDGLHGAQMIVIAARPRVGKTSLAMGMAEHIAIDQKKPIGIFSLEMTANQLIRRMLCSRSRVNLHRVRDGFLSERDFPAIQTTSSRIAEAPIYINDASGLNIAEIRAGARRWKKKYDIQALFIDYLQLIRSLTKRARDSREAEVAEASAGIKGLAKELNIPIVVLAQIGRDFEKRGPSARPRLSDLRESGAIEQDADVVGFISREELQVEDEEDKHRVAGQAELIIAKQRDGPECIVPLTFLKEYTRFEDRAVEGEEPIEPDQTSMFGNDPRLDPRRGKRKYGST